MGNKSLNEYTDKELWDEMVSRMGLSEEDGTIHHMSDRVVQIRGDKRHPKIIFTMLFHKNGEYWQHDYCWEGK